MGVKTTRMFHAPRLGVIRRTWALDAAREGVPLLYMSDHEEQLDALPPLRHAETGHSVPVPATTTVDLTREWGAQVDQKRGHCAKMLAIWRQFGKYHLGTAGSQPSERR